MTNPSSEVVETFIAKWRDVKASELSTSQSFLIELCALLGVDSPHATAEQDYMFERPITFAHGDGSTTAGRIDLYRRGHFVLESKKLKTGAHTKGFDDAMLRARGQAENYARALPAAEGRTPFVLVVDVGHRLELYSEFSRSGATYTPYPDPRSHRVSLDDLRKPDVLEKLRRIWTDPMSLDPSRESARVTREIAARLAELAKRLERDKHSPEAVAQFLMRCLFTMFAEDVGLLPADSFRDLLAKHAEQPETAMRMLAQLWRDMDSGGFSAVLANNVLHFNGKLFKQPDTLPLDREQIGLLLDAARANWKHVEPAIFGTLLERALDPGERHKLGAHYTPRAYVERLVLPTVIEPLREEWRDAQAAALIHLQAAEEAKQLGLASVGKKSQTERLKLYNSELVQARDILLRYHRRLCAVRVLDPACGSGNFLYVTLEHLKRLEGEVLGAFADFGLTQLGVSGQTGLDIDGARAISIEAETVDPHNLLGIELNPRAAAIAEVVLWIGYLQWHFRTNGNVNPPTPVIRDCRNIENRDAVLAYDRVEFVTDERGVPVTRWDGKTMKASPVTGEPIPDESARAPIERYVNPRKAEWPAADFVVGNPPFIGAKSMRTALGDGYVEALRTTWGDVPESADLVMYWWYHAALLTSLGALARFGFITTNSIKQTFNRRVVEEAMVQPAGKLRKPLGLLYAIADHPWISATDGAAVRIAMTVGSTEARNGILQTVVAEKGSGEDGTAVTLTRLAGRIGADLTVGADVSTAVKLNSNRSLSHMGVKLHGMGFVVAPEEAVKLGLGTATDLERHVRDYRNGRDLTEKPRGVLVIDLFGLSEDEVRRRFPSVFQHVLTRVKPERDQNNRLTYRKNWWIFAEPRPDMRSALSGLRQYIGTTETAKHRIFQFLDVSILPDQKIRIVASEDSLHLGILSSFAHVAWALKSGGRMGVGNDPVYNGSRCFRPFPFPIADGGQAGRIRQLAEHLDAHRKRQQSAHPDLTLTGMYNVLEKLRSGEPLSAKERTIHEHGLVSVLRQIHDDLDAAVLDAYGWADLLPLLRVAHGNDAPHAAAFDGTPDDVKPDVAKPDDAKRKFDESILERLVALNAERAAEEARGIVRWLRPEFQNPQSPSVTEQPQLTGTEVEATDDETPAAPALVVKLTPWPKDAVEQVRAVADAISASPVALSVDDIAARFSGRGTWKKRLPQVLDILVVLGRANEREGRYAGQAS